MILKQKKTRQYLVPKTLKWSCMTDHMTITNTGKHMSAILKAGQAPLNKVQERYTPV